MNKVSVQAQVFDYNQLLDENESAKNLALIEKAFGANGLGFLVVENVPGYVQARKTLLPLARKFANLPDDVKSQYVREDLNYQFGWSHGKEVLENGQMDVAKGSYYADPFAPENDRQKEPSSISDPRLCSKNNVWPKEKQVQGFEDAFKSLSYIMKDTARKLGKLCDQYMVQQGVTDSYSMEDIIEHSQSAKGRLLNYFPQKSIAKKDNEAKWCGWHCDHGSLTCLTKAMYFDKDGNEITDIIGDDLAIETSDGTIVSVQIPPNAIAFQVGQAAQIHSGSLLRATPHCVTYPPRTNVSRCTYALFLQPDLDTPLSVPKLPAKAPAPKYPIQFQTGMTFGKFSAATVDLVYSSSSSNKQSRL